MRKMVSNQYSLMTDQFLTGLMTNSKFLLILPVFLLLSIAGIANDPPIAVNDEDYGPEGTVQTGNVGDNDSDPNGDDLTFTSIVEPVHGSWTLAPDGSYSYQPNFLYVGFDYATYQVCDADGLCAEAQIEFGMTFVNYPPVAENDNFYGIVDNVINGDVTVNDVELNIEPVFFNLLTSPLNAAAFTFNPDGTFSYTPPPGYIGTDLFIYRMCDPCGSCDFATVNLEFVAPNPTPIAGDDTGFVNEDFTLNSTVAGNDEDSEGDVLTFNLLTSPAFGEITFNSNGTYTYVPNHDYYGPDSFTYEACDPYNQCDDATVNITVNFINDPPIALPDYYDVDEDSSVTGSVALNDFDADDEPLQWMIWLQPVNGDIIWNQPTGVFTYTPDPNFSGTDQVTYFMLDPCGETSLAILYFTVIEVNDPPVVENDSESMDEDSSITSSVAGNDSDIDSETLEYTLITGPLNGELTLNLDGSYTYVPNENFFGQEIIDYSVSDLEGATVDGTLTITVNPINDLPIVEDELFEIDEDTELLADVSFNDSDVENASLNYTFNPSETSGQFISSANGDFSYTPDENFFGIITIPYQACDESDCVDGILTIEVISVNDLPSAVDGGFEIDEDSDLNENLSSFVTDADDTEFNFQLMAMSAEGGDVVLNSDGSFEFIPDTDFFGEFNFVYEACDLQDACDNATISIQVNPVNDPPVAQNDFASVDEDGVLNISVTDNDSDIDDAELDCEILVDAQNGTVELSPLGQLTYTPNADFYGVEVITYTLCDSQGACSEATVEITTHPINDAPVAFDDEIGVLMNETLNGTVANNDFDIDSETLTFEIVTDVSNGVLTFFSNGNYTYSPSIDYVGFETVVYQLCDDFNACVTAELIIEVVNTNEAPQAGDDDYVMNEDAALNVDVTVNDIDPNDDDLVYTIIEAPASGTANLSATGELNFSPAENYSGQITITYQACDQFNSCSEASITITVNELNDIPVAQNDANTGPEDSEIEGTVADNDSDIEDLNLSFTLLNDTEFGTMAFNQDGTYSFSPNADFNGIIDFNYQVCDQDDACVEATLTIDVIAVNDAPVSLDDEFLITYSEVLDADVSFNDFDVDSDILSFELLDTPVNGVIDFNEDGTFMYTPNDGFLGTETLEYSVCDDEPACVSGMLVITVEAPNLPPVLTEYSAEVCEVQNVIIDLDEIISDDQTPVANLLIAQLQASEGSTSLSGHILTYTPVQGGNADVIINYTICDQGQSSLCSEGEITLQIQTAYTPTISAAVVSEVNCHGGSDGSISLELMDQESILSISWDNEMEGSEITGLAAGDYMATVEMDLACANTIEQIFTVAEPEAIEIVGLDALPINDTPGGASEFEVTGGVAPYSFVWTNGNGDVISEEQTLGDLNLADDAGEYLLTVSDVNECSVSQSILVTDIGELDNFSFSVYPNPVIDKLNISFNNTMISRMNLEIIDARGRLVSTELITPGQNLHAIDLSEVERGVYILRISSESNQVSARFIKQ